MLSTHLALSVRPLVRCSSPSWPRPYALTPLRRLTPLPLSTAAIIPKERPGQLGTADRCRNHPLPRTAQNYPERSGAVECSRTSTIRNRLLTTPSGVVSSSKSGREKARSTSRIHSAVLVVELAVNPGCKSEKAHCKQEGG